MDGSFLCFSFSSSDSENRVLLIQYGSFQSTLICVNSGTRSTLICVNSGARSTLICVNNGTRAYLDLCE